MHNKTRIIFLIEKKIEKKSWCILDFRSDSDPLIHEDPDPDQNETDPKHC